MNVWSLASGSSGNAYLLSSDGTHVLIECGLPARRIEASLRRLGVHPSSLAGVLLTHDHFDHLRSARAFSDAFDVPIYATPGTLGHESLRDSLRARPLATGRPQRIGELEVLPFRVPHDGTEPVGFRFYGPAGEVALVTDLGFVPPEVLGALDGLDLLIIEANHDRERLLRGPYPWSLKRRVDGELGHLSNEACGQAVASLRNPPRALWLAHLSEVNNSPALARATVSTVLSAAGLDQIRLEVAARNRPSLSWSTDGAWQQLTLW